MDTMNSSNRVINPGTPEEIEALFSKDIDLNEKTPDFNREYYFSLIETGNFEGFLPARIRNSGRTWTDYEYARSDTLEVIYDFFKNRFDTYLYEIQKDSPVYNEISYLKETTRKVFEKVYRKQPPIEAFSGPEEFEKYKELISKYLYENFPRALHEAQEKYPYRVLSDEDVDNLLLWVSGRDSSETWKE